MEIVAELTLVILLFTDASRINARTLMNEPGLPIRLLGIGLPLTMLLGTIAAKWLFPEFSWVEAALLSAILAPTDAALGQAVVSSERVPSRIRQALNVESGLNDGIGRASRDAVRVAGGCCDGKKLTPLTGFALC